MDQFDWLNPGELVDRDLMLVLKARIPADQSRGYVPAYQFIMCPTGQLVTMGQIELRVGDRPRVRLYGGHIGYAVKPAHRGHHFAARSCRLLLPLARRHGLREIWITCDPDNLPSRRTCELAGATFVEIVNLPKDSDMYQEGSRQKCRYRIRL